MTGKDQSNDQQQNTMPANKSQVEPVVTPAPRYEAAASQTWLQQQQQQQVKDKKDPGIPEAARPVAFADARFVPLPAGGIAALADSLYPDDVNDEEKMHQHVFDLMVMNRGILRDDTSSTVGTQVRIP